ncbi:MAG TPA: maleylpyruvate isomerase family mycothiol-dependent enzyme [Nocardioidaceae bacterium]|nr:maleylpyruvate isomerase family mycothiol-dependent enzyme [Nocardioidaceae bacterium]
MPTSLTFDEHLSAIERAGHRLAEHAAEAGLEAPVPTCPTWTAAHLVAHQAMVHHWAASHARGEPEEARNQTEIREEEADLLGYYREGLDALLSALRSAPLDLEAMTFLKDCGTPREFWARRQCHETTVHAVDALSAKLGRVPTAEEAALASDVAVDGIDELLRGFYSRGRSKLFDGQVFSFAVAPTDSDRRWVVQVDERLTITDEGEAEPLTGTAAQLYLGLWNRGDEIKGSPELLARWRENQRIRWS